LSVFEAVNRGGVEIVELAERRSCPYRPRTYLQAMGRNILQHFLLHRPKKLACVNQLVPTVIELLRGDREIEGN